MKTLTLAVGAFAATSLFAAPPAEKSVAVPFDFQVRETTLPAGHYTLQQDAFRDEAMLVNQETGKKVVVVRAAQRTGEKKAKLIFERKGEGYRLVQAW